jgi:hypothetical protein
MPRINVWIPDALDASLRRRRPDLNRSAIVQGALAAQLECDHDALTCSSCATPVDHLELIDAAQSRLYLDQVWELHTLVSRGGTAEGACRLLKEVASRHQVTAALRTPLPRATRAERAAAKVVPMPTEAASRGRHPTARSQTA